MLYIEETILMQYMSRLSFAIDLYTILINIVNIRYY